LVEEETTGTFMNSQLLIHSTVRQVMVLIAQMATSGGVRAPLTHIANQVFVELARELESQGVSRKVSADMFGMALRAYIRKVRRLSEAESEVGKTLWQAVLQFVQESGLVARARVLERFRGDGEIEVSSIIHDLTESGFLFSTGSGESAMLRAATEDELGIMSRKLGGAGLEELAWVQIFKNGPTSADRLAELLDREVEEAQDLIARLIEAERIRENEPGKFVADEFVIPLGATKGWEASIFDHLQAVVQTICQRLQENDNQTSPSGEVGGSTYTFEVWTDHPMEREVLSQLAELRDRLGDLRARVATFNRTNEPTTNVRRVVTYVGQCQIDSETGPAGEVE
jgi:hypothetical protein